MTPDRSAAPYRIHESVVKPLPIRSSSSDRFPLGNLKSWRSDHLGTVAWSLRSTLRQSRHINSNQQIIGQLTQEDAFSRRQQKYRDEFHIKGIRAGQQVHVTLTTGAFSPLLELYNARQNKLLWSGEEGTVFNSDGSTSNGLTFKVNPKTPYVVRVTSSLNREMGAYRLQIKTVKAIERSGYNFFWGYGAVDAAAAVAKAAHLKHPFRDLSAQSHVEGKTWGATNIQAPATWSRGYTGRDVVVAVVDTGVDYKHPDLKPNLWSNTREIPNNGVDDDRNGYVDDVHGWNVIKRNNNPMDRNGHGTHVAGIIAATKNDFGTTGIAYNAKIMPVQVLDKDGFGTQNQVAEGIRYAVKNGADVINLSLGGEEAASSQLKQALVFAHQAGVVVVMAAGNERHTRGATKPDEPAGQAIDGLGIAVGAIDNLRRVAGFSNPAGNRQLTYVVAPGVNIYSTVPKGVYSWSNNSEAQGTYDFYTGTSMATPYVAGVVALMLSANPRLTPTAVARILQQTANANGLSVEI